LAVKGKQKITVSVNKRMSFRNNRMNNFSLAIPDWIAFLII